VYPFVVVRIIISGAEMEKRASDFPKAGSLQKLVYAASFFFPRRNSDINFDASLVLATCVFIPVEISKTK
jgi:hypothetical protein